jgi:UDP-2-acetamido-3-amino-2,3-dideoxy-glucuronate N-acetyltransferase
MKKNIAVIGCGHWGKNLVRNFSELGGLAAVCDPDTAVATKYARQYCVDNLPWKAVIQDDDIEGIVLAVPAPLHAPLAIEALNSGKHVYVEKPLAMDKAEAKKMILAAENNHVRLMVGHLLHYHPSFLALKELVLSGELGDLRYIYSNRLSFGKVRTEEDVIWSFAPHDISMVLALAGQEPKLVMTEASNILQKDIADIATIHLSFASELKAHISVSWLHPHKEQKLVVIGESAMAVFDDTKPWPEKLTIFRQKVEINNGFPRLEESGNEYLDVKQSEPLKNECAHFMDVVAGKVNPKTDGYEGLSVLNVMSAASLSAKQKHSVRVSDI